MTRKFFLITLTALLVAASALAPAAAKEKPKLPRADLQPDKALVYVMRPAFAGFAVPMYFFANDQFLGVNHGNEYFWVYLPPGRYIFWSKSENVNVVEADVEAGKTYYLRQKTVPGWIKARTAVELVDPAQGEELIDNCEKQAVWTDEQRQRGEEHARESWARAQQEAAEAAGKKK